MSNRSLVILAALVLGLGAFIWFYERHQPKTDERATMAKKIFPGIDANGVRTFAVRTSEGAFAFERDGGGGWTMTAPLRSDADSAAVDGALSAVLELEKDRTMGPDEVDPATYELDAPEITVDFEDEDGVAYTLAVGAETPLGAKRAVSTGGPDVILTSSWFTSSLEKERDDWRSRDLCQVNFNDLAAIEVTQAADRMEAVQQHGRWRLESPVADLADEEHLRNLVTSLNMVRIERFTDGQARPGDAGTGTPRYRVRLLPRDGEAIELAFGELGPEADPTTVACLRNGAELFWVSDDAETALGKAPVLWRDPKVFSFDSWNVNQLTISTPEGEASLDRATGTWLFEDGGEADADAVRERLTALADLEALEHDLMHLGTAELGRVRLFAGGSSEADEIIFFASMSEGGHVLVEAPQRPGMMGVDPSAVDKVLDNLESLRRATDPPQAEAE
jgi:hypothetical protein